jgi:predicted component of type VI protein secretion system
MAGVFNPIDNAVPPLPFGLLDKLLPERHLAEEGPAAGRARRAWRAPVQGFLWYIGHLLNTRVDLPEGNTGVREAAATGEFDWSAVELRTPRERAAFCELIRAKLERLEPRLQGVSVQEVPTEVPDVLLAITVQACWQGCHPPRPVLVVATLRNGRLEVEGGGPCRIA